MHVVSFQAIWHAETVFVSKVIPTCSLPQSKRREAFTRANVGFSRAIGTTIIISPLDMAGQPGACIVTAVLQAGFAIVDTTAYGDSEVQTALDTQICSDQEMEARLNGQTFGQFPETLRTNGRLRFAAGQVFGRVGKAALSIITGHAHGDGADKLTSRAVLALTLQRHLLSMGQLPELNEALALTCGSSKLMLALSLKQMASFLALARSFLTPMVCVFDSSSRWCLETAESLWHKDCEKKCELFALFCAFLLWGQTMSTAVVIYTDNNAVRDTLISCSTNNKVARKILVAPWYSRVPTDSNSSDAPSRLSCQGLIDAGVAETVVNVVDYWQRLQVLELKWGQEQVAFATPAWKRCCSVSDSHLYMCQVVTFRYSWSFTVVLNRGFQER